MAQVKSAPPWVLPVVRPTLIHADDPMMQRQTMVVVRRWGEAGGTAAEVA